MIIIIMQYKIKWVALFKIKSQKSRGRLHKATSLICSLLSSLVGQTSHKKQAFPVCYWKSVDETNFVK